MIKVALVRGKYLNNFEGQNYLFDKGISLTGISSLKPLHELYPFPVRKFFSPADLSGFFGESPFLDRAIRACLNRLVGDQQILFGLEKIASDFDIFHTADPHYYFSYQLAKMRAKNVIKRLVMTSWETIPFNNETVARKKQIKRYSLQHADLFLCYTEKAKKALVEEGVKPDKIRVVRLGVDLAKFKPAKKIKQNEINILFVGRLVEEKGIIDLYEAYKQTILSFRTHLRFVRGVRNLVKRKDADARFLGANSSPRNDKLNLKLIIIGEGNLKNQLLQQVRDDYLENEVSFDSKAYEEMPKVYQEADILVVPSKSTKTWEEQYGMVLVEAMASGLPVIAYDSGAILEVLDKAGILVETRNVAGLARALISLINNHELRLKLKNLGRKRAEKYFDSKKSANKITEMYHLIDGRRKDG